MNKMIFINKDYIKIKNKKNPTRQNKCQIKRNREQRKRKGHTPSHLEKRNKLKDKIE